MRRTGRPVIEVDWVAGTWCALALFLGGSIKGTLGVGTPLLTVPLMALVLPVHTAVVLMAVPVVVANLWQVLHAGQGGYVLRRFWPVFLAILAGTFTGSAILASIDARPLLITVGLLAILFAVVHYTRFSVVLPPRLEIPAGLGFGALSGVVGGLSSMFGPALIVYLVSLRLSKDLFVSTIGFLYVSAVVPWAVSLLVLGLLDSRLLLLSTLAALPVSAGVLLGRRLRRRVAEEHFRSLVLVILLLSGSAMLWRGIGA